MNTSKKIMLPIIFILLSQICIIAQDFTRQPSGTLAARVKKQVYPDDTYSMFDEVNKDYGTYIPPNPETDARVFFRSIWEFEKPTGLTAGSYVKKVEIIYNGNSAKKNTFIAGNAGDYNLNLSLEQKWNLADNVSTTTSLPGANGTTITRELYGFADVINNSTSSKIYIGFKPINNTANSDLVTLTNLELKITYEVHVSITADNNFTDNSGNPTHGLISVSGHSGNQVAPFTFPKVAGQSVTLSAISPQTDIQGYQEVWQPTTALKSEWKKNGNPVSYNQAYTFNVTNSDYDATYQAQFRQIHATTSGTLSSNETWFTNVTLNGPGDVIVPSGVTLSILSGASVSLNGHSIISTGGTINKENGAEIDAAAYITETGILKGLCPTIQAALTNAPSSGCFVEIQPGTYSENVSISNKSYLIITGDELNSNLTGSM